MHKLKVLFAVLCAYSLAGCVNDDGILRSDGLFANMNENYIDFDAEGASKVVVGMEIRESTDHDQIEWVGLSLMQQYQLAPADVPLLEYLNGL